MITEKLLIGRIPFLVCCPYFHLSLEKPLDFAQFIDGTPYVLNNLLLQQKIDCAPTSSIEYAKNHHNYFLLPNLSTGSHHKIQSVLFLSNVSWEKLTTEKILLSKASSTSNILFQILSTEKYNTIPNTINLHTHQENNHTIQGKICIGDQALLEDKEKWLYTYDLAQEWFQWQKLPFSFGLWIVHKKAYQKKESLLLQFYENLQCSLKKFHQDPQKSLDIWEKHYPCAIPNSQKLSFLSFLKYRLTHQHLESLHIFYEKAFIHNLIPSIPSFKFLFNQA